MWILENGGERASVLSLRGQFCPLALRGTPGNHISKIVQSTYGHATYDDPSVEDNELAQLLHSNQKAPKEHHLSRPWMCRQDYL